MRHLRNLKRPEDSSPISIEAVKTRAVHFLQRYFSPEEKILIKSYIDADPTNWWTKFDQDNGSILGEWMGQHGYGENFLGQHQLSDMYLNIIEQAVRS